MKKSCRRHIISLILFLSVLVLMSFGVTKIISRKASIRKLKPFFEQKDDFDVLFTGISHVQVGVMPMEMWERYGITSFNFGESGNCLPSSYWVIRNALDYCDPKLVVIDVNRMDFSEMKFNKYVLNDWDAFPLSLNKIRAASELMLTREEQIGMLFPIINYHSRWTKLSDKDLHPEIRFDMGSSRYSAKKTSVGDAAPFTAIGTEETAELAELSETYLRRLIELCQERNIEVLLTLIPYPATEENQRLANSVNAIAEEYDVNYVNFLQMDPVIDLNTDMNDVDSHVNDSGGKKISDWLGQYIVEHYDIEDHRGDAAYSFWTQHEADYQVFKADRLKEQETLEKCLMLLADEDMRSEISISRDSKILEKGKVRILLDNLKNVQGEGAVIDTEAELSEGEIQIITYDKTGNEIDRRTW